MTIGLMFGADPLKQLMDSRRSPFHAAGQTDEAGIEAFVAEGSAVAPSPQFHLAAGIPGPVGEAFEASVAANPLAELPGGGVGGALVAGGQQQPVAAIENHGMFPAAPTQPAGFDPAAAESAIGAEGLFVQIGASRNHQQGDRCFTHPPAQLGHGRGSGGGGLPAQGPGLDGGQLPCSRQQAEGQGSSPERAPGHAWPDLEPEADLPPPPGQQQGEQG